MAKNSFPIKSYKGVKIPFLNVGKNIGKGSRVFNSVRLYDRLFNK